MKTDNKILGKPIKLLWPFLKPHKLRYISAILAMVISASAVIIMGFGLQNLVDMGFAKGDEAFLDKALIFMFLVVFILSLASYTRVYLVAWLGERIVADLRSKIYSHLVNLDTEFFEKNKTGEIISRLTTDTTVLQMIIRNSIPTAIRNSIMLSGGLIMLFISSPKMTGMVLLIVPFLIIPLTVLGKQVRVKSKNAQEKVGDLGSYVDESLHAIQTVQSFAREEKTISEFSNSSENAFISALTYTKSRAILTSLVIFMVFSAIGVVLWVGGQDVFEGNMSGGELSAFIFYSILVAGSVSSLSEVVGALQRAAGSTDRLLELLEANSNLIKSDKPIKITGKLKGFISFKDVSFAYPMRSEQDALSNINLEVKSGETIAIIGESGAGKTTIFQILLRFYNVKSGKIKLDNIDISDIDPQEIRQHIGVVSQDPTIFSTSITDNIRYGNEDASFEDVKKAAKAAQIEEFIVGLEDGYDSLLGERGCRLSGGQKQRIAIARVLLKNPEILLLDEATSALDAGNEDKLHQALQEVTKNRTTIIIAHRLSTIQNADRIIVMQDGRIVDEGNHKSLIKKDGVYKDLAELQLNKAA